MAKTTPATTAKPATIKPGTPEMEAFLRSGYPDMTVEKAETIIKERKQNPVAWSYEMVERAEAFLAAYRGSPKVIDTETHWTRG